MPDTLPRPTFKASDWLQWWPVGSAVVFLVVWAVTAQVNSQNLSNKLTDMQTSLLGIKAETSAIPRLVADQANFERRLITREKADETQDERLGRVGDSIGSLRAEVQELRADIRYMSGSRQMAPAPTARAPR